MTNTGTITHDTDPPSAYIDDRMRELLHYDPATGNLRWKITRGSRAAKDDVAGSMDKNGYLQVGIDGKDYKAHRIAWMLHYGDWPLVIDHINGITSDNRIWNLRSVTQANNTKNSARHCDGAVGLKGVHAHQGKFCAQIFSDGIKYYLGVYDTAEEAHAAYCGASRVLHKEFARIA